MQCNLRPSDVASVALGSSYETYNAPAYEFNNCRYYTRTPNFSTIVQSTVELFQGEGAPINQ